MTPIASSPRLLGDLGGTNLRLAWQAFEGATLEDVLNLTCAEHAGLVQAIRAYLRRTGRPAPAACAIGVAAPINGDRVQLTNLPTWSFSISELQRELGLLRLKLINDFTALALSLPYLRAEDLLAVGGGRAEADAPKALIGPGTGLGVSVLVPCGEGRWTALQTEGGHVTLPATLPKERAVIDRLALRYGHVSAERVVSGAGLQDIYRALCELTCEAPLAEQLTAADITERFRSDARCAEALHLFCAFLGSTAGNLALTVGARGGVYIGGGIVPRLGALFEDSPFRERFEAKGRFRDYLAEIPTFVINAHTPPALTGAAYALSEQF
jgi:glucokinase